MTSANAPYGHVSEIKQEVTTRLTLLEPFVSSVSSTINYHVTMSCAIVVVSDVSRVLVASSLYVTQILSLISIKLLRIQFGSAWPSLWSALNPGEEPVAAQPTCERQ